MDLRRLSSFLAVVDEGSFTRGARRLGIAQPSLSQQIRLLEAELGGQLLERLPRGVRLTAAGRALLLEALADRHWILFQPGHGLTEVVDAACRRAGFQPRVAVRTTQVEAATRLAAAGLGPAMVPDNVVSPDLEPTVVHLDPPVLRELAAYTRSEWSPLASAFLEALQSSEWARRTA